MLRIPRKRKWDLTKASAGRTLRCGEPAPASAASYVLYILYIDALRLGWEKNLIDQQKHDGLAFERAALVFNDPFAAFRKDRIVEGEPRWHAIGSVLAAVLLVVICIAWRIQMTKKKASASSSRPAKRTSVSAESVFSRPVNKVQPSALSKIAKRQAAGDDSAIDYSEIPALTDEQLAQLKRDRKVLIAARIDKEVYDWLMKYGKGYSTRINGILRKVMEGTR